MYVWVCVLCVCVCVCVCVYIYIYTLTGHFIRYTLLVPSWTPFYIQNCLNSSWHKFNKVLETFLRDFGPYWHDSMKWISRSTTSQRCSIGLRSGDCGGHLSKVNSLSGSRNQSEMIWALWHGALSCWKYIRRCVHCSYKGMDMVHQYSGQLWCLNDAQLVLRGLKCAKKISPTPLHHHHQPEPLRQGRMDSCFHVLYAKFWPYHLNVAAEIKTHQIRQRFYNLLLSSFGDPVWIVDSVSCSYLTLAVPGVVFCCCSSSSSGFDVLCVQRWYSAY